MPTKWKQSIPWNNTTVGIILIVDAPFALCAINGILTDHSNCPLLIFYWLMTITGLLTAQQVKTLGRRYALTVSREFVIYKEPFRTRLLNIAELLSIRADKDNKLTLKSLHTTLVVPRTIFKNNAELRKIKKRLERFAPPACRLDLQNLAPAHG